MKPLLFSLYKHIKQGLWRSACRPSKSSGLW